MLELQIKDLCVGYNGKEILHNISLDIENGSFIAIVGPSGAGKSTLLKQINRLDLENRRFDSLARERR